MEARVFQCRNITSPGCEGGLTTRCSVREGTFQSHNNSLKFGKFLVLFRVLGKLTKELKGELNDPSSEVPLVLLHGDGDRHSGGGQAGLQDGEGGELPGGLLLPPHQGQQVSRGEGLRQEGPASDQV